MVAPVHIDTRLPTLQGPPTPPSDQSPSPAGFFGLSRLWAKSRTPRPVKTTLITPNSSIELRLSDPAATAATKKVVWAHSAVFQEPPGLSADGTPYWQDLQVLAPSSDRKPAKSILKTSCGNVGREPPEPNVNVQMLQSMVEQLAGKDTSSRIDAYTTLAAALKGSGNLPDFNELRHKMDLFLQFIQRDITTKTHDGRTIAVAALTLVASFLHKDREAVAELLDSDFKVFLIEHTITTLHDPGLLKDVAAWLMNIMALQKFSSKVMSAERVGRLLSALHVVEDHSTGKSISVGRTQVYRTLIRSNEAQMLAHATWIEDLLADMLHSNVEIQSAAITLGFEASVPFGTSLAFSRTLNAIFAKTHGSVSFISYYAQRLKDIAKDKDQQSRNVPRVWAVIISFLRVRPTQLERWEHISLWLSVMQACFNGGDMSLRVAANCGWNRFVSAIRPDENTSPTVLKTLMQPLIQQLGRVKDVRQVLELNRARKATIGSVCNLLYYSLHPMATAAALDRLWDLYVAQLVGRSLMPPDILERPASARQDLVDACQVLEGLFNVTRPRTWYETRATDEKRPSTVDASELPPLDSKWLRKNSSRVFSILDPLLCSNYWDLSNPDSAATNLWKAYITSIAAPATMEIKVSNETMACVARTFGMLSRIWQNGQHGVHAPLAYGDVSFLRSFQNLTDIAINGLGGGLGLLPFTERLLSMGEQADFIVIATPSHKPGKVLGKPKCPLHHLIALLMTTSPGLEYGDDFSNMVRLLLAPFFRERSSAKGKMDLVKDLVKLLPTTGEPAKRVWNILAEYATTALFVPDGRVQVRESDQPLGTEYRLIVKILGQGLELSPDEPPAAWNSMFEALGKSVVMQAGETGRAIAVIEPLSKALLANIDSLEPNYCQTILRHANFPRDHQALESAKKRLWGFVTGGPRFNAFDPYQQLYVYISKCLEKGYGVLTVDIMPGYAGILEALCGLLGRSPAALRLNILGQIQPGVALWVQDDKLKIPTDTPLMQHANLLWSSICSLIPNENQNPSKLLVDFELLICSGLESRHRSIANAAIEMWNASFGVYDGKLDYPAKLQDVLGRLHAITDIALPSFPESLLSEYSAAQQQPRVFAETQDASGRVSQRKSTTSLSRTGAIKPISSMPHMVITRSSKRIRESTPEQGARKSRKKIPVARLRHDDSQVQFEAIDVSSPINDASYDSHVLTDRQREVRERQEAEAAMFPDIRSSPRHRQRPTDVDSEMELPLLRSASRSAPERLSRAGRESTPVPPGPGDYDEFLASSPTPTRALCGEKRDMTFSTPPQQDQASPDLGEVVAHNKTTLAPAPIVFLDSLKDVEIPSSPPEMHAAATEVSYDGYNVTSFPAKSDVLEPYAQHMAYTLGPEPTFSTYVSTPQEQPSVLRPMPVTPLEESTKQQELPLASLVPKSPSPSQIEISTIEYPSSVINAFVDARSSPPSSDRVEVFEDAKSTPSEEGEISHNQSSQYDDPSIIRIMGDLFPGPARLCENMETSKAPSRDISDISATTIERDSTIPAPLQPEHAVKIDKTPSHAAPVTRRLFASASTIPETPARESDGCTFVDTEGHFQTYDPKTTIMLDVPDDHALERKPKKFYTPKTPKKMRKSIFDGKFFKSPIKPFKKRTLDEISQESVLETPVESATEPSKKRRVSGRPTGAMGTRQTQDSQQSTFRQPDLSLPSQHSQQSSLESESQNRTPDRSRFSHTSQIDGSLQKRDLSRPGNSLDFQESRIEMESECPIVEVRSAEKGIRARKSRSSIGSLAAARSIQDRASRSEKRSSVSIPEQVQVEASRIDDSALGYALVEASAAGHHDTSSQLAGTIEETRIGDSSSAYEQSKQDRGAVEENAAPEVEMQRQVMHDAASVALAPVSGPTAQSIQAKLRVLMDDLSRVALKRDEVNRIEDMFMDAKELLFGAARRGRERRDDE